MMNKDVTKDITFFVSFTATSTHTEKISRIIDSVKCVRKLNNDRFESINQVGLPWRTKVVQIYILTKHSRL